MLWEGRTWLHIMFVTQHLQPSPAACSNLLPQLVTTYLSQCLLMTSRSSTASAGEDIQFYSLSGWIFGRFHFAGTPARSIRWMCSSHKQVFSSSTVARSAWTVCACLCEWARTSRARSDPTVPFMILISLSIPLPQQAKDQRHCLRGRSWTTTSGTLWRWCGEARACSCLWITSQWKVRRVQYQSGFYCGRANERETALVQSRVHDELLCQRKMRPPTGSLLAFFLFLLLSLACFVLLFLSKSSQFSPNLRWLTIHYCDSESHTEVSCCEAIFQKKKVGSMVTRQNKHPFGQGNEIIKAPSIHPSIIFYQHFSWTEGWGKILLSYICFKNRKKKKKSLACWCPGDAENVFF